MINGRRFIFMLLAIFDFFCQPRQFHSEFGLPSTYKDVTVLGFYGLCMDGQRFCFFMPIRSTKICCRKIASRYEVSSAIVTSTNHGQICLTFPSKLFEVDLTVCMDISPNPGPELGFEMRSTGATDSQYNFVLI